MLDQVKDFAAKIDEATNAIAARIQTLIDKINAGTATPEENENRIGHEARIARRLEPRWNPKPNDVSISVWKLLIYLVGPAGLEPATR